MFKQAYELDSSGYIKKIHIVEVSEEGMAKDPLLEVFILEDPPHGLYRARWVNEEWVEDMSQEEIDELQDVPQPPSDIDILGQELVDKDIRIMELEAENQMLGQLVVDMDIRLIQGGL